MSRYLPVRSPFYAQWERWPYTRGPNYTRAMFREQGPGGYFTAQPMNKMPSLRGLGEALGATEFFADFWTNPTKIAGTLAVIGVGLWWLTSKKQAVANRRRVRLYRDAPPYWLWVSYPMSVPERAVREAANAPLTQPEYMAHGVSGDHLVLRFVHKTKSGAEKAKRRIEALDPTVTVEIMPSKKPDGWGWE